MGSRLPALALAMAAGLATPSARADVDYSEDAESWNGIGYLLETAAEAKVGVETSGVLDLRRLRPGDVIFWLQPEGEVPVDSLLEFIRDGGFLIVADDAGGADELLAAVGVQRRGEGPTRHGSWYQGQEGVPILRPSREHFLFFNVDELAANYPAVLRGAGDPVLAFDDASEALVIERRIGEGGLLLIADPSIFLNEMLRRFYGNKQFAANVMRLYCDGEDCRLRLVAPGTEVVGRYRSSVGRLGRIPALFEDAVSFLNGLLVSLNAGLGGRPWSLIVTWTALACFLGGLWLALRQRRRRRAAPPLDLAGAIGSPIRQETLGLVMGHGDADFAEPAQVLLDEVERLGLHPATASLREDPLPTESRDRTVARNALLRIQREADSLQRSVPTLVSAERFLRLLADVGTLSRYLEQRAHADLRPDRRPAGGRQI